MEAAIFKFRVASKRGDNDVDGSGIMQERPRAVETTTVTDFIELKERDKVLKTTVVA